MIQRKTFLHQAVAKPLLLTVLLIFTLTMAGCGGVQDTGDRKGKLVLADVSWDSIKVHNRIVGFILEKGYGYPKPQYTFGETLPMLQGLTRGNVDIYMEVWKDNFEEAWEDALQGGTIKDLGSNYPDAPQGWYVPTYLIKGDPGRGIKPMAPDLKSVTDLPRYYQLFKDPEVPSKGRFHNSPPGWSVTEINEVKFKSYGLDQTFNLFSTGSDTALAASMAAAYEKGQPWVGYYWEPTWVMGQLDMTMLEEAPFDQAIWEEESNRACAFPAAQVLKAVHADLEKTSPEVVEFIAKYETTLAQNNDFLAYMSENNAEAEDAAIYFLKKHPDTWKLWLPDDIAGRVEKALEEVK